VQRPVGEFGEEVGQDAEAALADGGRRVIDEGEEYGDVEGPVFGDELGLGLREGELAFAFAFVLVGFDDTTRDTPCCFVDNGN
jgi:hypothetical protein